MQSGPPTHLPVFATACLKALAEKDLGHTISLGGAVGLLHYLDYRSTKDVDGWWAADATPRQREKVLEVIETTLEPHGEVRVRSWGDVVTVDLRKGNRILFNFQIADRSAQLEESKRTPWVDVLLDSLPDLLASKMVALVERGAPRDFRDIHAACQAGLASAEQCWDLWRRRQDLSKSDKDAARALLAVQTHLERIARHRPLDQIDDPSQRRQAETVRTWFREEFLNAFPD